MRLLSQVLRSDPIWPCDFVVQPIVQKHVVLHWLKISINYSRVTISKTRNPTEMFIYLELLSHLNHLNLLKSNMFYI